MENKTLKLMEIMITIGIFIPTLIGAFFTKYSQNQAPEMFLSYFFLAGLYILSFVFVYAGRLENKGLEGLIIVNLFFVALLTIYLSQIPQIEKLPLSFQFAFNLLFINLGLFALIVMPFFIIIFCMFLFFQGVRK